jgi:hypothetical protein
MRAVLCEGAVCHWHARVHGARAVLRALHHKGAAQTLRRIFALLLLHVRCALVESSPRCHVESDDEHMDICVPCHAAYQPCNAVGYHAAGDTVKLWDTVPLWNMVPCAMRDSKLM